MAKALATALGLLMGCGRLTSCGGSLEGAETRIRKALEAQRQTRLELSGSPGGSPASATAELSQVRYAEVITSLEGTRATVVALVEAEGKVLWGDRSVALSYLGRESFHMRPCDSAGWCAEDDRLSRLRGVLRLLWQRQDAFNERRPERLEALVSESYRDPRLDRKGLLARLSQDLQEETAGRQQVQSWQIRVERGGAEVGEDYLLELPGQAPGRLRARYVLSLEGEQWVFTAGL